MGSGRATQHVVAVVEDEREREVAGDERGGVAVVDAMEVGVGTAVAGAGAEGLGGGVRGVGEVFLAPGVADDVAELVARLFEQPLEDAAGVVGIGDAGGLGQGAIIAAADVSHTESCSPTCVNSAAKPLLVVAASRSSTGTRRCSHRISRFTIV
jgi:hypothetical protein